MPTATPQTILPTTSSQQQLSHTFIILLGDCHSVGYDPTSPVLSVEDPRASMEMLGRTRRRIHSQRFLWLVCAVIVSLASARTTAMTRSNARGTKPAELGTPSRNTLSINSLDSVMDLKRNLQNIVINYPRTDPPGTPTAAPTAPDKAAQQVTCRSVDPSVEATRTEVQFVYQAETNEKAGSLPEDFLNEELPALVAGTAITLSADIVCGSSGAGSITNSSSSSSSSSSSTTATNSSSVVNGTNADQESPDQGKEESPEKGKQGDRRLGSLSDCILVLSTGPMGRLQANCTPTLDVSKSCSEYADSFFVLHTSDCSPEDVKSGSLSLIAAGVASPTFLEAVNAQSVDVVVTKLTLLEDFYAAGIASPLVATTGGLTAGGITVVTLVVLVTLALVSFLYVWRRHVVRRNRRLDDDLKSIRTSWSHPSRDDGSYLTANFNDLARRHTKLNVHKCKSALCEVCRPNLGVVHMVPVPKNAKLSAVSCDLVRNDTMDSWDNVSSLANPESVGPTPARYNEPLELEPFAELDDELQLDGQDVIISVQEVDDADGEEASHVSYVRSSHARRSEPVTLKKSISSNQVLL